MQIPRETYLGRASAEGWYADTTPPERGRTARTIFGRLLIYGSPFVAGAFAGSYWPLMEHFAPVGPYPSTQAVITANAALAAIGAGAGVPLLTGGLALRVMGSLAYGVLALFLYGFSLTMFSFVAKALL
jgi:hypothetical protein